MHMILEMSCKIFRNLLLFQSIEKQINKLDK